MRPSLRLEVSDETLGAGALSDSAPDRVDEPWFHPRGGSQKGSPTCLTAGSAGTMEKVAMAWTMESMRN